MSLPSIDWPKTLAIAVSAATVINFVATFWLGIISRRIQQRQIKIQEEQAETSARQFRLALFEKRMPMFEATIRFLVDVANSEDTSRQARIDFVNKTEGHSLLFGPEVGRFLREILDQANKLGDLRSKMDRARQANKMDEVAEKEKEADDVLRWFEEQVDNKTAARLFHPYIDFTKP